MGFDLDEMAKWAAQWWWCGVAKLAAPLWWLLIGAAVMLEALWWWAWYVPMPMPSSTPMAISHSDAIAGTRANRTAWYLTRHWAVP